MIHRRFLAIFVAAVTLVVVAAAAGRSAVTGGGALAGIATVALGLPGTVALIALGRLVWLDGRRSARRQR